MGVPLPKPGLVVTPWPVQHEPRSAPSRQPRNHDSHSVTSMPPCWARSNIA
jgi:hypothetical protein